NKFPSLSTTKISVAFTFGSVGNTAALAFASSYPFDLKIKNSGASFLLATLYCIHKIKPKFRLGALALCFYT
ncbi:hypothetical protein ACT726_11625, partial [Ornithobacterium rhinotracheale]